MALADTGNEYDSVISSVFVWICSLSTTLFISRRVKRIDMVQALKGVE